jgi:hypothetical protein
MVVLLHGAVGGWDEVAVAVAAFAVLWVAVKLAGRKPASDDEDEEEESAPDALPTGTTTKEHKNPAHSSSNLD